MSIVIKSTRELAPQSGCKVLVYGASGAGKTRLAASAQNSFVVSAEKGLLSLRKFNIPATEIASLDNLANVYNYLNREGRNRHKTIMLDSCSDIAEVCYSEVSKKTKDPRKLYPEMQERVTRAFRDFRDLAGRNVCLLAKEEFTVDAQGSKFYQPMFPGQKLAQAAPYFVDEVFRLTSGINVNPQGASYRYWAFQCHLSETATAKDRSGNLDFYENADPQSGGGLDYVFRKMVL